MPAIGGWQPKHAHSEFMNAELEWTAIDDYPYSGGEYINEVAPIYHENNYYIFGNYGAETDTNIGRLSCSSWTWSLIGHLKVITSNYETMQLTVQRCYPYILLRIILKLLGRPW